MVLGAVSSLLSMIKAEKNNKNVLMAASLAQDVMQQLRSRPCPGEDEVTGVKEILSEGEIGLDRFYERYASSSSALDNFYQVNGIPLK